VDPLAAVLVGLVIRVEPLVAHERAQATAVGGGVTQTGTFVAARSS
jgi:hypothetical protein